MMDSYAVPSPVSNGKHTATVKPKLRLKYKSSLTVSVLEEVSRYISLETIPKPKHSDTVI